MRKSATATERWSQDELQANLSGAPEFRVRDRVDDEALTRICKEYTAVTGDPVLIPENRPPKKRNLIAAAYRVHGADFIPYARDLFLERGTATNLLGILRSSPPRTTKSTQTTAALASPKALPVNPEPPTADGHHGDSSSGHIAPWTTEELVEAVADVDHHDSNRSLETVACFDFHAHQSSIRWVGDGWVCFACVALA